MARRNAKRQRTSAASAPIDWRAEAVRLLPFVGLYLGVELILRVAAERELLTPVQRASALAAAGVLGWFDIRTVMADCSIVTDLGTVTVNGVCMPITPFALGLALIVFATPARAWAKAAMAVALLAVLMIANIARIALVTALVDSGSPLMMPIHQTIAPIGLVAVALGVWLACVWVAKRNA